MLRRSVLRRLLVFAVVLSVCTFFAGCGSGGNAPPPQTPTKGSILPDRDEPNLAELLSKPRAELAELGNDAAVRIGNQVNNRREGQAGGLLADTVVPLAVPVLREAKYSPGLGVSVPPYFAETSKDTPLALHLARHGDVEVALKIADPADLGRVRNLQTPKSFPVEWTRLVGLLQHSAELALAADNLDGAKQLISMRRQLEKLLDDSAPASLRAALLPRGRRLLEQARDAWRAAGQTSRVQEADSVLAKWAKPAEPAALPVGRPLAELAPAFGANADGHLLLAPHPARALDLLSLPFPDQGVQAVAAFGDTDKNLTEILILYQAGGPDYRAPGQLALLLEEHGAAADAGGQPGPLPSSGYRWAHAACAVTLVPSHARLGAFVRLGHAAPAAKRPALTRNFGALHLDRSFEQNRVRLALQQRGQHLVVDNAAVLKTVKDPVALPLTEIIVEREPGQDAVAKFQLQHAPAARGDSGLVAFTAPLWRSAAAAQIEAAQGHIDFVWDDSDSQFILRLPANKDKGPLLLVSQRGSADAAARAQRARAKDDAERRARLERNEPLTRLPRHVDHFWLGMTRAELDRALPTAKKREMPGGFAYTLPGDADPTAICVVRELFARLGEDGKAVEVRARYTEGPAGQGKGLSKLLASLKSKGGAPEVLPPEEDRVWGDILGKQRATTVSAWQDDLTGLVARWSPGVLEFAVSDRASSASAPAHLTHLPRGLDGCKLGQSRAEVLKGWKVAKPTEADGAVVLPPPAASPYDAVLVWFNNDAATRIVARHRAAAGTPALADKAVRDGWVRQLAAFGWPWTSQMAGVQLQGWGSHDAHTRLRVFWQQERDGCRIFTEWKDLR
jgi:hypothetical protein